VGDGVLVGVAVGGGVVGVLVGVLAGTHEPARTADPNVPSAKCTPPMGPCGPCH
jgi:hypothetical protein